LTLLIENEVQKVENACNRNFLYIIVQNIKHLLFDFRKLVDIYLEPEAMIQKLGKCI